MNWGYFEILITGGSGSLGKTITKLLLKEYKPHGIRIFSRSEFLQWEMKKEIEKLFPDAPVSYLIGDIRDYKRLNRAVKGVDIIINAAAMKQVPACEHNPIEAVQTNVVGSENIINAAIDNNVKKVIHISTDKACNPINLYGKTKAVAESLFMHSNVYNQNGYGTKFCCVRYGNVLGSRGSIVPLFREQAKTGTITITDKKMTRFWTTLENVSEFILDRIEQATGGEIFIPKMPSMSIMDVAKCIAPYAEIEVTGIRKGEKLHEALIAFEESMYMTEFEGYYVLRPLDKINPDFKNFAYFTDTNNWWLESEELKILLEDIK